MRPFHCPMLIESLRCVKRRGESEAAYGRRFERWLGRLNTVMNLRNTLETRRDKGHDNDRQKQTVPIQT
jgi:hypothetical protein